MNYGDLYYSNYIFNWAQKNWCFWIVVLKKTLEIPLDCKEIKPVNPKGNQSWIVIGKTDVKAETPMLWPPDAKNWLMEKTLMLGKIEGSGRREWQRMRWLDGITDLTWVKASSRSWWWTGKPGELLPWGRKESNMAEWLNWNELMVIYWSVLLKIVHCVFFFSIIKK